MFAGDNRTSFPRRGLLAGAVPAGSTIIGFQLTLFLQGVAGTDSTPRTIGLRTLPVTGTETGARLVSQGDYTRR